MKKLQLLLTTFILLILWAGCSKDSEDWKDDQPVDMGEELLLTLDLMVPGTSIPTTYALTEADENELKTIDLLVFKDNGVGNDETFLYQTHATDIDNNGGSVIKKFRAQIKKSVGSEKHRIVLITNARNEIDAVKAGFTTTMTKEDVLKMIVFDTDTKWNTTSSANFTPLPMWGETAGTHVITATTTGVTIGTIKLLRSVARIDVGLKMDANNVPQGFADKFKIEDVKVYNANAKSQVVPLAANITNNKATLPSLVATPQIVTPAIAYTHTPADFGFVREIYVGEADIKNQSDDDKRMCIVIGGYYTKEGDPVNTTQKTWYRIDFFERSTNPQDRLDILRNHRYRVNITSVDGPGYETEEQAFKSRPVNMDTEVIAWDEADMNDITSDGQYQLTVDKSEITLYEEGNLNPQKLKIYTDHPDGWTIDYNMTTPWIQVTPNSDASATELEVDVTADPYLNQTELRELGFWIKAGKLKKWIKVIQLNEPELTIDVTPTQIVFRKSGSQPKSIVVTTYPATAMVNFSAVQGANPISWLSGTGFPVSGLQNIGTYTFQPDVNNSGNVLMATVVVSTVDAVTGMIRSKNVTITQLATDMLFAITNKPSYPAIGGSQSFTVESDAPWQLSTDLVSDPENMLSLSTTTEQPANPGNPVPFGFSLTPNPYYDQVRIAKIYAKSSDIDFPTQEIEVTQLAQGPYLKLNGQEGNIVIDFGTPTSNAEIKQVKVTSNAGWRSNAITSSYLSVVTSWQPVLGEVQIGSTIPTISKDGTINIKPNSETNGFDAAGTQYSADFTVTTVNHGTAPAISRTVTVKRKVQPVFNFTSLNKTSIGREGGKIIVNANTNAAWQATPSAGTASAVQNPTPWGYRQAEVTISGNTTWSTGTTPVNRWITITAKYGLTTSSMTSSAESGTLQQPGYFISGGSTNLASVTLNAGANTNVSVTVTGAYPTMTNQIRALGNNTQLATGTVSAGESGSRSGNVVVPANPSWTARTIQMQYYHPGKAAWQNVGGTKSQAGYAVTGKSATTVTAAGGGTTTVSLSGYRPNITVRVLVNGAQTSTGTVGGGTGTNTTTLAIPANTTTTTRAIVIQGMLNGSSYSDIASWTQDVGNHVLSTGRIVAKADLPTAMGWTEAMGIPSTYNNTLYNQPANYTLGYPTGTGCSGYSEPGYPAGTWRVPTSVEIREIDQKGYIEQTCEWGHPKYYYHYSDSEWTGTTNGNSNLIYVKPWDNCNNGIQSNSKQHKVDKRLSVRCVRTP